MKIEIIHEESDTQRFIYGFEIGNIGYRHVSTMISNRNDKDDVWGDEWYEHYKEEKNQAINKVEEDMEASGGCMCGCQGHNEEIDAIEKCYNPICQKTDDGRSYYTGMSGNMYDLSSTKEEYRHLYQLKLTDEEIKEKLKEAFALTIERGMK